MLIMLFINIILVFIIIIILLQKIIVGKANQKEELFNIKKKEKSQKENIIYVEKEDKLILYTPNYII